MLISLAKDSLISRKKTVLLTLVSLTVSMLVVFGVQHLQWQLKESFNRTNSGTDLIVGAPSGPLNLLLYSVFRLGQPTNSIKYQSFITLENKPEVKWAIPLALGDSHRGYRVLGTNNTYFEHYGYGEQQKLELVAGKDFDNIFDVVLGAEVAARLDYKIGDQIIVAHGIGNTSFSKHKHAPLKVTGILQPTGTPVDKTVHVTLDAITAIHLPPTLLFKKLAAPKPLSMPPRELSAVMLGLESKMAVFKLQRQINNYQADRLMAILPGVAMSQLWQITDGVESALMLIAALVVVSSFCGLTTMLLASINERQSEIAVLRVLGARPWQVTTLIFAEVLLITALALVISISGLMVALTMFKPWLASEFGLFISSNILSNNLLLTVLGIVITAIIAAIIPAFSIYRKALHQQLS